jgi:hypothetical protein
MADLTEDYLARAVAARAAASLEVLANVREKHLVSAATWDGLARSKLRIEAERASRAAMPTVIAKGMEP